MGNQHRVIPTCAQERAPSGRVRLRFARTGSVPHRAKLSSDREVGSAAVYLCNVAYGLKQHTELHSPISI